VQIRSISNLRFKGFSHFDASWQFMLMSGLGQKQQYHSLEKNVRFTPESKLQTLAHAAPAISLKQSFAKYCYD
jgi:hypothetical protein